MSWHGDDKTSIRADEWDSSNSADVCVMVHTGGPVPHRLRLTQAEAAAFIAELQGAMTDARVRHILASQMTERERY